MKIVAPLILLASSCASTGQSLSVMRDSQEHGVAKLEGAYELGEATGWKGWGYAEAYTTHADTWGEHSNTDLRDWNGRLDLQTPTLAFPVGIIGETEAGGIVKSISRVGAFWEIVPPMTLAVFPYETDGSGSQVSLRPSVYLCPCVRIYGFADASWPEEEFSGPTVWQIRSTVAYEVWSGIEVFAQADHWEDRPSGDDSIGLGIAAGF